MSTIIKTEDLRFSYAVTEGLAPIVLDGVDLEIEAGSFVAVLGHNGSGKSTLAKHLNALLLPSGGNVYVDGIDTADEERLLDIRRTVGMANVKDVTTITDEAKRAHAEKVNILCGKDYIMNRTAFKTGADFVAAVKRADEAAK